jgi:folate-binding protein YgfZ
VAIEAAIELDGQYRVLREGAGLLGRESRVLSASGPDAAEYLQGQLTNDIEALGPGQGCYAALLDRKGHVQADMRVLRIGDAELLIVAEPAGGDALLRHLAMYKIGSEVEIADVSAQTAVLSLIGPAATATALDGPLGPEHAHREASVGGITCRAAATDVGVDVLAPGGDADAVADALRASGAEAVSEEAVEILRVEHGRPRFGREMTTATMPQEAGINERAVSFTKGCYIGQETVARLHYRGKPNRALRGLRLAAAASAGDSIALGEREVGTIGTAVLSPSHGPIALAIVRREAAPGAAVTVGDGVAGEVVELPF